MLFNTFCKSVNYISKESSFPIQIEMDKITSFKLQEITVNHLDKI